MAKVVGYAMLAVSVICLFTIAMQVSLLLGLSDEGLGLLGEKIRGRIAALFFGGVIIPAGFSALILKK